MGLILHSPLLHRMRMERCAFYNIHTCPTDGNSHELTVGWVLRQVCVRARHGYYSTAKPGGKERLMLTTGTLEHVAVPFAFFLLSQPPKYVHCVGHRSSSSFIRCFFAQARSNLLDKWVANIQDARVRESALSSIHPS